MWYVQGARRVKDNGKFQSYSQTGTAKHAGEEYRDWSYRFVSHQTGTSIRRTNYHVSIADSAGNQVEYLRGFHNLESARAAAREWIDQILKKIEEVRAGRYLGTIPALPEDPLTQEDIPQANIAQEK